MSDVSEASDASAAEEVKPTIAQPGVLDVLICLVIEQVVPFAVAALRKHLTRVEANHRAGGEHPSQPVSVTTVLMGVAAAAILAAFVASLMSPRNSPQA